MARYIIVIAFIALPSMAWAEASGGQGLDGVDMSILPPAAQEQIRVALRQEIERAVTQAAAEAEARLQEATAEQMSQIDVVNRSLDLLESFAGVASARMNEITPEVWRIMSRQQYITGARYCLVPVALIILGLVVVLLTFRRKGRDPRDRTTARYLSVTLLIIIFITAIFLISHGVGLMLNPEYYVIRDILQMTISM
jgi:hypothetical protein